MKFQEYLLYREKHCKIETINGTYSITIDKMYPYNLGEILQKHFPKTYKDIEYTEHLNGGEVTKVPKDFYLIERSHEINRNSIYVLLNDVKFNETVGKYFTDKFKNYNVIYFVIESRFIQNEPKVLKYLNTKDNLNTQFKELPTIPYRVFKSALK